MKECVNDMTNVMFEVMESGKAKEFEGVSILSACLCIVFFMHDNLYQLISIYERFKERDIIIMVMER